MTKETWLKGESGTYSVNDGFRLAVTNQNLAAIPTNIDHHTRFLPMLLRNARLGYLAIIALVFLRFVIGFHFYMEGIAKVREGGFSSTGFLASAKGPLAKTFQSMVPDFDGSIRLDTGKDKDKPESRDDYRSGDLKQVYDGFIKDASRLYNFTEEQKKESEQFVEEARKQLVDSYKTHKAAIDEYKSGIPRIASLENDEMRTNVASMRRQRDEIETKWRALVKQPLYEIDRISAELEKRVNGLATDQQSLVEKRKIYASLRLQSPAPIDVKTSDKIIPAFDMSIDVKTIDKIIPIFDMSVGILLMLGLLTPLAGLAAGLFLASVVLTQFPGSYGSVPTYYQAIEMLGCFFLAFSDAGRYAGLDFLPWSFWNRNKTTPV